MRRSDRERIELLRSKMRSLEVLVDLSNALDHNAEERNNRLELRVRALEDRKETKTRCGCDECNDPEFLDRQRIEDLEGALNYVRERNGDLETLVDDLRQRPLHIRVDCNHSCNPGGGTADVKMPAPSSSYYDYKPDPHRYYTGSGTDSGTP